MFAKKFFFFAYSVLCPGGNFSTLKKFNGKGADGLHVQACCFFLLHENTEFMLPDLPIPVEEANCDLIVGKHWQLTLLKVLKLQEKKCNSLGISRLSKYLFSILRDKV